MDKWKGLEKWGIQETILSYTVNDHVVIETTVFILDGGTMVNDKDMVQWYIDHLVQYTLEIGRLIWGRDMVSWQQMIGNIIFILL